MGRWENSEVAGRRGGRVVRRQTSKGGRILVLFQGVGHRVSPRLHLFVFDVKQRNEGAGLFKIFL